MVELALVFLIFGGLGVILLSMNRLLGPARTNPTKEQPFECGSPYLETAIKPFRVQFYLVAFIFLLFDVEVVFFFPCSRFRNQSEVTWRLNQRNFL